MARPPSASSTQLSPPARAAFVLALATLASAATLLVKGSESHKSRPIDHHSAGHHGGVSNTTGHGAVNNTAAYAESDGPAYSPFTLTLVVEIVKFCTCVVVVLVGRARERKAAASDAVARPVSPTLQPQPHPTFAALAKESLWYAVPSALYMIDNNLLYYILNYVDAATHILLWQLKIPVTAVLFRVLLNHPLSNLKWCALALLFCGVLTTQSSNPEIIAQMTSGGSGSRRAIGVTLILVGVFVSAAAGVYTEWVLKRRAKHNFFVQNSLLYVWGIVFNMVGLVTRDLDKVLEKGFFVGCTWFCPTIILVNAAMGLSYAVVFKYVDNIATLYAHVLSMLMIVLASWLLFNLHLSLALLCGFTTCILSLWLYHHKPMLVPANAPKGGPMYTPVSRRNGNGGVLSHSDSDDSEYGGGSRSPNPHSSRAALRNRGSSDQAQGDLELMDMQLPDVDDV